ncbi:type II secretion system minor pseudopilin GspJ [Vibrio sp. MA40-2]|uniref:type II secretion system minor pseudopilin GspJ n=1 Tax=Vibrio sp. MA40-2 TaxID=3391828 RepID=UPI0039A5CC03
MLINRPLSRVRQSTSSAQGGFTLIEVLVAIAIFASLSLSAYMVLNQIQRSNQLSLIKTDRLKQLQRAMIIIDNDFRQIALRQFRTDGEEASDKLIVWGNGLLQSDNNAVLFTRLGWQNPQQMFPRGEVAKVGYRIVEHQLERIWWRYPDTPVGQDPLVTPLLNDVDDFTLRFYNQGSWSNDWDEPLTLPEAVSITFTLQDYGRIERVYLTAGDRLYIATDTNENGSNTNE